MKRITKKMIRLYKTDDICWMGYMVSKDNPYTFHHLVKIEDGGKREIKNGAILTYQAHNYLHLIEQYDIEIYLYINEILKVINIQGYNPNKQQLLTINAMLKQFEEKYKNYTNCRQKLLIKKEYYNRVYNLE